MSHDSRPNPPLLAVRSLSKSYNGVPALREVDLDLFPGQVHSLCGENGAGKSTLIEILAGNHRADSGSLVWEGHPVQFRSPADAIRQGIAVIHQEFSLVDELSVAENLLLGQEPRWGPFLRRPSLRRETEKQLEKAGFTLPLRTKVGRLPTGQRQLVEIAKALSRNARLLILDEPTSALTRVESEQLSRVIRSLRSQGLSIVYVSHHLDDVLKISDRVTVLRDGRNVDSRNSSEHSPESLMTAMVGDVIDVRPEQVRPRPTIVALQTRQLSGRVLSDVSLQLHRGEILGVTGLAGAGHEELSRILFGSQRPRTGEILVGGARIRLNHPAQAIAEGIASIPADRRREGLLGSLDIERNITITQLDAIATKGWISTRKRSRLARSLVNSFEIACAGPSQRATTLSGGNQQKVILARWMANHPSILIFNDPTRGIDVKTREVIHRRVEEAAAAGAAVLLVTSDTQELRRLADRVLVFRRGRVAREVPISQLDDQTLLAAMIDAPQTTTSEQEWDRE